MRHWLTTLAITAIVASPLPAHFVWIIPVDEHGQKAQLIFSDEMAPDANVPITKVKQTKLFLRGQKNQALPLQKVGNAYHVTVPSGVSCVHGTCLYGVVAKGSDPFLLYYHPKAVVGSGIEVAKHLAKQSPKQPMEILATIKGKSLTGTVVRNGKPLAESEVVVTFTGVDRRVSTISDDNGNFRCELPAKSCLVSIRARAVDQTAGKHDGKEYKVAKHYATLTFTLPTKTQTSDSRTPDAAATKLLKDARAARYTWENFPGFSADLSVNDNGVISRGSVVVMGNGRVKLEGFANEKLEKFLNTQLRSLVSHRLDNASDRDTPCCLADDNANYPLGQKIHVLNDELHSSYRIRDKQIIEVFRQMGDKIQFKITVLKNRVTPDKKFLPETYVVNTWEISSDRLISSQSFHDQWQKVGGFYLPSSLMIVSASSQQTDSETSVLDVRELQFTNLKLLAR